nr:hypothetical protein L203_04382 [Cryptococcus depauperatus CBS 7841]
MGLLISIYILNLFCFVLVSSFQRFNEDQSIPILSSSTRQWIDHLRQKYDIPGTSVVVVRSPRTVQSPWESEIITSGIADQHHILDSRSLFSIASNTKLFTALSIGILIDRNVCLPNGIPLAWTTKMEDIWSDWGLVDDTRKEATVEDLLTMRTGVPYHPYAPNYSSRKKLLHSMRHLPSSTDFRSQWQYNNENYLLLGYIVPALTNISFPDFVEKNIFHDLGMEGATFDAEKARATGKRTGVRLRFGGKRHKCLDAVGINTTVEECLGKRKNIGWWTKGTGEATWGGAGLIMDSVDTGKWLAELLAPTTIPAHIIKQCIKPHIQSTHLALTQAENASYGYAQWTHTYRKHKLYSHCGFQLGQHTLFATVPKAGIALAAMNTDHELGDALNEVIINTILDELLGLDRVNWVEKVMRPVFERVAKKSELNLNCTSTPIDLSGTFHHPAWGNLTFTAVDPELVARLSESLPTIVLAHARQAVMNGRDDWYLLLIPCHDEHSKWLVVQLHDHMQHDMVTHNAIARLIGSGDASIDEKGMGLITGWFPGPNPKPATDKGHCKTSAQVWFNRTDATQF